jgi:hypothetical protein
MGPLIPQGIIAGDWNLVIAVLLGMAFGYVLESSGFSSSRKLIGVFYGYDFTVLRVFFTAAVTAAVGMVYFDFFGWFDLSMIYVNPTYLLGILIGGGIMGLGFIMGGYCPGTSYCGVAIGKIDAMVFTGGMLVGIFLFSEVYAWFEVIYTNYALGPVKIYDSLGISSSVFLFALILAAMLIFVVVTMIEKRVKKVEY